MDNGFNTHVWKLAVVQVPRKKVSPHGYERLKEIVGKMGYDMSDFNLQPVLKIKWFSEKVFTNKVI